MITNITKKMSNKNYIEEQVAGIAVASQENKMKKTMSISVKVDGVIEITKGMCIAPGKWSDEFNDELTKLVSKRLNLLDIIAVSGDYQGTDNRGVRYQSCCKDMYDLGYDGNAPGNWQGMEYEVLRCMGKGGLNDMDRYDVYVAGMCVGGNDYIIRFYWRIQPTETKEDIADKVTEILEAADVEPEAETKWSKLYPKGKVTLHWSAADSEPWETEAEVVRTTDEFIEVRTDDSRIATNADGVVRVYWEACRCPEESVSLPLKFKDYMGVSVWAVEEELPF